ncbi:hypothetical protein JMJ35_003284 [Cladonia borealis]|uniref:Opioid growth factor receptor (OGFr) conserved domain-containing protein n=1 Tax=Cladonia borealis TaxID=184061 RepID=A0AA39R4E7_9LECA|nr:hypothetical protein JMJ35_003284 [Cladonia borealis]
MASHPSPEPFIVQFYDPNIQAKDRRGRTRSSILAWSDDELEYHHDYIQLLFPLPEGSPFNPSAPVIDEVTFYAFRSRLELQTQLRASLQRMLHFYGFQFASETGSGGHPQGLQVLNSSNYSEASRNWLRRFNHNHLRITRILRSLRVLGLEKEAWEFFKALKRVYEGGRIGQKSMMFWTRAIERPLFLAPEDEDYNGGCEFLYEFESGEETSFIKSLESSSNDEEEVEEANDSPETARENKLPTSDEVDPPKIISKSEL